MEEMLLRMCVIVASLLYIKDHTVYQEQEEKVLMDLREREYLLQKEAEKLEQEAYQVTAGLPHSNQEVLQSHDRLTDTEDSGVQKQMKDIQDEGDLLTHDIRPTELQYGVDINESVPLEPPEMVSGDESKKVQEDEGREKDVPHSERMNGKSSQLDEVEETSNQMPPEDDPDEKTTEEISTDQSTETPYNWYLWKILSIISVIRLLRKFIFRGSQSSGTPIKDRTTSRSPVILSKTFVSDQQVLDCFYDQCVRVPPGTCGRVCEFVEGLVDELLEAARVASDEETDMQIGDFVGVGSLYELWATGKTTVCDLYVPITAPRSHGFEVELWKKKDASLFGLGKIKMVQVENTSNGCPCMNGNADDMLCLIHPHNERRTVMINAVGGPLCQENTPYLSKKRVVRWFRSVILKTWREISHKYEFELGFRNQAAPGALRVRFRSGQIILFNITPVVQVKASDVFLLSYLSTDQNISDIHWPISFASYEKALLQYFNKTLPNHSCHVPCLQILSFLHKQQTNLTGKCGLTSHHLKSALLHLLMNKPTEWKREQLTSRLMDMLAFLEQRLQAKEFHHALIGNRLLPKDIGLPKEFQTAKPINIFQQIVSDQDCYLKTVRHFQELVKNAPVFIQEFGSVKSSNDGENEKI